MIALGLVACAGCSGARAQEKDDAPAPREVKVGEHSRLAFYGFARLDAIYDDSRPSDPQTPTFVPSEQPGTADDDTFTLHPRLTRLGMRFDGPSLPALGGAELSGNLEVDFQNGGRESRAVPRYRHAYLDLSWDRVSVLAGQTWDLISPLYPTVNNDTMMWNAGNLGDRRAQIRVSRRPTGGSGLHWGVAVGLTGAVDDQDLDDDDLLDGEDAAIPSLQARLAHDWQATGGRVALGVWGHLAEEEVGTPIAGRTTFDSWALGVDYEIEVDRLYLKGEAWTGENLDDVRGGIGQSVDPRTGEEIESSGGWIELGGDVTDRYSLAVGYTLDDPEEEQIPTGGRIENSVWYLVNRMRLAEPLLVGVDYLHWTTEFQDLPEGDDNRFNLYAIYTF